MCMSMCLSECIYVNVEYIRLNITFRNMLTLHELQIDFLNFM
jgi:hypothetical protein